MDTWLMIGHVRKIPAQLMKKLPCRLLPEADKVWQNAT